MLRQTNVNVFDLVEAKRNDSVARSFRTAQELAAYSRRSGRMFPADLVQIDTLLARVMKRFF